MFKCPEIKKAKPFDGHDEHDVKRLLSLVKLVNKRDTQK
jgi:hypothetical protein